MPGSRQKLVVVHTNDIHSHFEQMPKIASVVDYLKSKHDPENILLIDCGDHMDRMRIETEGSDGLANIAVMNQTGYEAIVLGNNEGLTSTKAVLHEMYGRHAEFSVIGSNMFESATGKLINWMKSYEILQKKGLRIGLIGVTMNYGSFYKLLGWDVPEPTQVIADLVKKLRPEVHILIVISHMGLNFDKRMAEEMDGIDCIFGGHTHHLLEEPIRIGNTSICAAGKFGQYVGEVEIEYDFELARIRQITGRCIDVNTYHDSEPTARLIREYLEKSIHKLNISVVTLQQNLSNHWETESQMGNLLASGLRKWTSSEVGIVNAGQINEGLMSGDVTREMLLRICPSPINPCRMLLEGKQILLALEEALLEEYILMPIRGFGFRGTVLGTLCLDGITVEYDSLRDPYHRIKQVLVNDEPLNLNRKYVVGSIDMFSFGIGYISLKGVEPDYFLPEFIRDVLLDQLRDPLALLNCSKLNWIG